MMAKALLSGDSEVAERIVLASDPRTAKALGRQVRGFDEQLWAEQRFGIVVAGNWPNSARPQLGQFLLATGDRVLVEASPRDRVWGIGLAADDERAASPRTWQRSNLLGFALMEVRHRLPGHHRTHQPGSGMTRQPQPPGLRHDRMCWRTAAMDVYAGESVRSSVEVVIDDCPGACGGLTFRRANTRRCSCHHRPSEQARVKPSHVLAI